MSRPSRFTARARAKFGLAPEALTLPLQCDTCGHRWELEEPPLGVRARPGWWICPSRACNDPKRTDAA